MRSLLKTFFLLVITFLSFNASASHLMGGNITYICLGNNTYSFTAELYRDCNGITLPNTITLQINSASCNIADVITLELLSNGNNPSVVTPLCPGELDRCNDPLGVYGVHKYTYVQLGGANSSAPYTTTGNCNDWEVFYLDCCRNAVITTGGANGGFSINAKINTSTICNNSPVFGFDPIFYGCVGDTVVYGHGVSDIDNDSLYFSLMNCYDDITSTSNTYISYNPTFSGTNPLSNSYINVDHETGTLTIVPTMSEVGIICLKVEEFRNGIKIGETMRDIQMSVLNCSNSSPTLSGINGTSMNSIDIWANQASMFTIDAFDADPGQLLTIANSFSLLGATYNTVTTNGLTQMTINWTPTLADSGINHLNLSVRDDACPLIGKGNYTYVVNVKGLETYSIGGVINRADSTLLKFSWVYLLDSNKVQIDSSQTNFLGKYGFNISDIGNDYYLKVIPSMSNNDQVTTYYNTVETIQNADSIPINTNINIVNFSTIDTANATGGKAINGVLYLGVENDPVPLSGIRLILKNANGDFINDAITNDLGEFSFYGLDNSVYSVWVDKVGINNMIAPVALASDASTEILYFELFDNRLEALIINTNSVITENDISIYPNPVTTELMIEYDLEKATAVNISIVDLQGKQVKILQNENQNSGNYQLIEKINKNLLPNGIYFIRLQFDNQIVTKQIIIQTK